MKQLSCATLDHQNKKKRTKRKASLVELETIVPCPERVQERLEDNKRLRASHAGPGRRLRP